MAPAPLLHQIGTEAGDGAQGTAFCDYTHQIVAFGNVFFILNITVQITPV
jgi:hypothetical protein